MNKPNVHNNKMGLTTLLAQEILRAKMQKALFFEVVTFSCLVLIPSFLVVVYIYRFMLLMKQFSS